MFHRSLWCSIYNWQGKNFSFKGRVVENHLQMEGIKINKIQPNWTGGEFKMMHIVDILLISVL